MTKGRRTNVAPTVDQISADKLTRIAGEYWSSATEQHKPFDSSIIDEIYEKEILNSKFSVKRIMLLEFSHYLENYLWHNFVAEKASYAHVISIVVMINEKFRERVPAWQFLKELPQQFPGFLRRVLKGILPSEDAKELSLKEHNVLLRFVNYCFSSLEIDIIREQIQRLVSLPIWVTLNKNRREAEFKRVPKLKKFWKVVEKSDAKLAPEEKQLVDFDRHFLRRLIDRVDSLLQSIPENGPVDPEKVEFCVRFLEFMIDIEALLPTRRFFNAVLDDSHILVKMKLSNLPKRPDGKLFSQLVEMLEFYAGFEIDDQTGESLTDNDMVAIHYEKVHSLQLTAFRLFKDDLRKFALTNVSSVDTGDKLKKQLEHMSPEQLYDLTAAINLLPARDGAEVTESREFLMNLLIVHHERRVSQLNAINNMPLYPTEEIVWDENVVPSEYFQGDGVLALPKLNLQFLTLHDYLLRNFHLFRLESTYEIRQDVEDITVRMKPFAGEDGGCVLGGWARMAQPISSFSVVEVAKPNIGEDHPSRVRADITVTLSTRNDIKWEWESLRRHDVCFLVTVRPTRPASARYDRTKPFVPQMGLTYIRGCEVEGMLDENGKVIEEFGFEQKPRLRGDSRTWRVLLDPCQYQRDMERTVHGTEDVYETFNIVMRRKPKENNFKAVLETIRDLMNTETVVPEWLHDLLIGYGDPSAAHYSKMENQIASLNFNDTFLDADHLRESFPTYEIKMTVDDPGKQKPPFRLTFLDVKKHDGGQKRKADGKEVKQPAILAEPFLPPNRGPYPYNEPKRNSVRFTPTQVEAIRAGMQPGLTMVVGPPGTGKTDVAVQIISNIYHNFPDQRTLIVTHSNQALNQLFEKIMALDVDERHLLRMGHGEESLETEKDFSRYGRVNFVLQQRIELLNEVQRLQESIDVPGDVAYTCETASHFYQYHVYSRWDEFLNKIKHKEGPNQEKNVEAIAQQFPFTAFFANAPQPVFKGRSYEEDFHIADGCFAYIKRIFTQLEEFRSFELLRNGADRALYLLVKEAKIIAMTCTHAALKRRDLVEAGFKYDNVLMEESAQILEVETFIPLFLQTPDEDGHNRLKRWIMIGDHNQLPPVIKNMAFQKYSNMEQSLFARFVRLVVPTVDLDAQGRARPSICNLYNWRYKNLGNLPHVHQQGEFQLTNPGFVYDFQLIDVEDFNGIGESEPSPYFYQNLGEAEYVVAVYTYMRLLGYPAEKISILTTYNGQKHLIRDVVEQRCSKNQLIGRPHKVTTVDKYQGQQNDYILLSLVRTKTVGHLRDVRRLVVAMSRARLGLIVFARASLFRNCFELAPTFNQLVKRPMKLHICPGEVYPGTRKVDEAPPADSFVIENMPQMAQYVFDLYQEKLHKLRDVIKETPPSLMRQQPDEEEQEAELHEVFPGDDEQPMDAEEKPAGAQANPEDQPFYDLVKMETHNLNREEEDYDPKLDAQINVDSLF